MFNKKSAFFISVIFMLIAFILFLKMNSSAISQQEESLKIKHQLEQQDAKLLKDMDAAGAKARSSNQTVTEEVYTLPSAEPDEYKNPRKWINTEGRHGLVRTANSVWTVKGILEPNQEMWDEFVAWSGMDYDGKQVIGTFVENGGAAFNGKYDVQYTCPNQNVGKIYITGVSGNILFLKTDIGIKGNFNIETQDWIFDK